MSLPLIDNAFSIHWTTFRLIEASGAATALIMQLAIGALACHKMRHHQNTGQKPRFLFWVNFFLSCSTTITIIKTDILTLTLRIPPESLISHPSIQIGVYLIVLFFSLSAVTMLGTLVIRLYLIFSHSVYAMKTGSICMFVMVITMLIISCSAHMMANIIIFELPQNEHIGHSLWLLSLLSGGIFYFFGSFMAVRFYVKNVNKLARSRTTSHHDLTVSADAIPLNDQQRTLLRLSAKAILLFVISVVVAVLSYSFWVIVSFEMRGLFISIDLCINLLCLYLQFAFAAEHYKKLCFRLDARCHRTLFKRTRRTIHLKSMSQSSSKSKSTMESVEDTVSIASV